MANTKLKIAREQIARRMTELERERDQVARALQRLERAEPSPEGRGSDRSGRPGIHRRGDRPL